MAVLLRGKFLYLATPRTGSSATAVALKQLGGRSVFGGHHVGLSAVDTHKGEPVFTTIRNPYDVLATWFIRLYRNRDYDAVSDTSFADFLRHYQHEDFVRGDPPSLFYHCHPGVTVMRWETLQRDLDAFLASVSIPTVEIPRDNVTPHKKPWRDYYDADTLDLVHERFGHDLDKWGYPRIS